MNIRLKMNQRVKPVSQALDLQYKKKNSRQMTKPQKKRQLGTRLPFLQIPEKRGREQGTATKDITQAQNTKTTG